MCHCICFELPYTVLICIHRNTEATHEKEGNQALQYKHTLPAVMLGSQSHAQAQTDTGSAAWQSRPGYVTCAESHLYTNAVLHTPAATHLHFILTAFTTSHSITLTALCAIWRCLIGLGGKASLWVAIASPVIQAVRCIAAQCACRPIATCCACSQCKGHWKVS